MSMITLKHLERFYPLAKGKFFYVLRDINLEVNEGDFVSIMGPSGAGESSLLHVLGMHDHAWTGEYYFEEAAVHTLKPKERATLRNEQMIVLKDEQEEREPNKQHNCSANAQAPHVKAAPVISDGKEQLDPWRCPKNVLHRNIRQLFGISKVIDARINEGGSSDELDESQLHHLTRHKISDRET
jgi:ABC-type oligopeptide transport system ATPase subunit